jgi:hypothetical protein
MLLLQWAKMLFIPSSQAVFPSSLSQLLNSSLILSQWGPGKKHFPPIAGAAAPARGSYFDRCNSWRLLFRQGDYLTPTKMKPKNVQIAQKLAKRRPLYVFGQSYLRQP